MLSLILHAAVCDEQCSLHGGVCDNGVCEFRCSDYAGYTCQNSSRLLSSLSICRNVLGNDISGQHCAPSEASILQQLEEVVVMPNYHRLFPGGARKLFNIFGSTYCDETAKRLACWVSSIFSCQNYSLDPSFSFLEYISFLVMLNFAFQCDVYFNFLVTIYFTQCEALHVTSILI